MRPEPGDVLWHRANDRAPSFEFDVPYLVVEVVVVPGGRDRWSPDRVSVRLFSLENGAVIWLEALMLRDLAKKGMLYKS